MSDMPEPGGIVAVPSDQARQCAMARPAMSEQPEVTEEMVRAGREVVFLDAQDTSLPLPLGVMSLWSEIYRAMHLARPLSEGPTP